MSSKPNQPDLSPASQPAAVIKERASVRAQARLRQMLSGVRMLMLLGMAAVLVVCLVFAWMTRDSMEELSFLRANRAGHALVDLRPWETAETLAAMAVSSEEINYAREAERLADHEVDQAFAAALRLAGLQNASSKLVGKALVVSQKAAQLQQMVQQDQANLDALTKAAKAAGKAAASDDIDVVKAQLDLDQDELEDAQRELARVSGDQRGTIQQELAAHEAQMTKYDAEVSNQQGQPAVVASANYATLLQRLHAWLAQRTRHALLQQAMRQAQADVAILTAEYDKLESQADATEAAATATPLQIAGGKLAALKLRSQQGQILSIYDDRIETQQQLADVYAKWSAQVMLQHRIAEHLVMESLSLIAFIVLAVMLINMGVRNLLSRPTLDRRRAATLQTIVELGVQLLGLGMVLLVVFGVPRQMPTILGLATAGLTFVMQPFILAFVGWFVLMGKNGIRVGDWVEINGVGGEVVEIGLLRTAMLETGNWTDKGHPTGRRVTFINNFAISGQYFNFSTTGQWMWDEIKVSIPSNKDTYAIIEAIHKAVLEVTDKDARQAEAEWKQATRQNNMSQFSAVPAVDMRPGSSGIDIIIRYVTRATDRYDMRNKLFERIIALMEKPKQIEPAAAPAV
ncbi:MAG: mechanosensitive ion channel family protein [Acidobacteriaceae bacterium]